jgi:glyoxylase-like metal-dependent hydrolase (beta-lactamase superfamily II)
MGYALCYSVQAGHGVVLVDLGWDSDEAWDVLTAGLRSAGAGLPDVTGAIVTHLHPDHFGLAARLRASTGAWIAVHPAEMPHVAADEQARDRFLAAMASWLRSCGSPPSEFAALAADAADVRARLASVRPDAALTDGAGVPGTDGELSVLHTPGHTPGHLCVVDRSRRLLFTGDHVLPRVTPNVSWRPDTDADPLADYTSSLERLRRYADHLVLPGHEWAFDRLGPRLDVLAKHHDERLAEMESVVRGGARTTWDVTCAVGWRRPFATLEPIARRSALGETSAHLIRLAALGRITRAGGPGAGDPVSWRVLCLDRFLGLRLFRAELLPALQHRDVIDAHPAVLAHQLDDALGVPRLEQLDGLEMIVVAAGTVDKLHVHVRLRDVPQVVKEPQQPLGPGPAERHEVELPVDPDELEPVLRLGLLAGGLGQPPHLRQVRFGNLRDRHDVRLVLEHRAPVVDVREVLGCQLAREKAEPVAVLDVADGAQVRQRLADRDVRDTELRGQDTRRKARARRDRSLGDGRLDAPLRVLEQRFGLWRVRVRRRGHVRLQAVGSSIWGVTVRDILSPGYSLLDTVPLAGQRRRAIVAGWLITPR